MKRFIRENFKEGRLLTGRNVQSLEAEVIRTTTGSDTNHNAMSAYSHDMEMGFNEAVPPVSKHTTLDDYERLMNDEGYIVRVYRFRNATEAEHSEMARYFREHLLGVPYPKKRRMVMLSSKLYNLFYDHVKMMPPLLHIKWCTALFAESAMAVVRAILDGYDGKRKKLPTPRTMEKRIIQGLFVDETDLWIEDV